MFFSQNCYSHLDIGFANHVIKLFIGPNPFLKVNYKILFYAEKEETKSVSQK